MPTIKFRKPERYTRPRTRKGLTEIDQEEVHRCHSEDQEEEAHRHPNEDT
jgi:hypothetical protein